MATIRKTEGRIEYLFGLLKEKTKTVTRSAFWKIPHKTHQEDICLKIGRYNKNGFAPNTLEVESPKSELTLDNEEFQKLLEFFCQKITSRSKKELKSIFQLMRNLITKRFDI